MNKLICLSILLVVLLSLVACSTSSGSGVAPAKPGLANPASVFCVEKGGQVKIVADASGNQSGTCVFPDGSQCEEWAFYRGQCAPGQASASLTFDVLKNTEYPSEFPVSKKAKLTDGKFEEAIAPGAATKLVIALHPTHAFGDLSGDGAQDAAVILVASPGGSGSFYSLVAVLNQGGQPKPSAAISLGDRVKIEAMSIQSGEIVIDLVTHGPQDPLCCPTLKATQRFKLQGDRLMEVKSTDSAASPIVGVTWKWEHFDDTAGLNNIKVNDPAKYTLKLNADGTYQVQADCNTGHGKYTLEGSRLTLGPMAMTRAACGPESLDSKYVARLGDVATYVLRDGKLYLNLKFDSGNLVFAQ